MEIVAWIAGAAALVVAADRLVALGAFDRCRPRVRRPRTRGSSGVGALGELIEVFQPSRTHVTDEQQRQRHTLQDAGDAAPPIDLDAGVARVDAAPPSGRRP